VARFTGNDMTQALALIQVASSMDVGSPFDPVVLGLLARLVPGDVVAYTEREVSSRRLLVEVEASHWRRPGDVALATATFCCEHPLSIQRHSGDDRALRISDVASTTELHHLDYYQHALRPLGLEHQMRLWLTAPPGVARYFCISRTYASGDFTERERELLQLLRPALNAIRARFDAGDAPGVEGLSDREAEVLGWVARGKKNGEIAALLLVSPHTVRTHLENAYAKLGVHSRTAAVRRAFGPPPAGVAAPAPGRELAEVAAGVRDGVA
jgi:DNA-binding CsgD family transcriptional regulator